jgi:outer membrane protein TolC
MRNHAQESSRFARATYQADASLQMDDTARGKARENAMALLARGPLTQDDAVRIALLQSPAFQSVLADTTRDAADAARAALPVNPVFTFERLVRRDHGQIDLDIGRALSVTLLDWLTWPLKRDAGAAQALRARLQAAGATVDSATRVREAWVRAVAAQQALTYFEQVMSAAEASAELAKRMYEAGNFSRLQRARQHAFYAEAAAQLTRARQASVAAREELLRTMGLDAAQAATLRLPDRLPDLPTAARAEPALTQNAIDQRLDVQLARAELNALAKRLGVETPATYINAFHVSAIRNSETGKPAQRGFELELGLPMFDFGSAQRAGGEVAYLAAFNRTAQTAQEAASRVRESYASYRTAHDLALHYRLEVVPLRKTIADETLLKYNGMLASVFDLLAESRAQISSVIQAIDAERDFWLADAALQATILGRPVQGAVLAPSASPAESAAAAH